MSLYKIKKTKIIKMGKFEGVGTPQEKGDKRIRGMRALNDKFLLLGFDVGLNFQSLNFLIRLNIRVLLIKFFSEEGRWLQFESLRVGKLEISGLGGRGNDLCKLKPR